MKITKEDLKQLIKEEFDSVRESRIPEPPPGMDQGEFFDSQQKEIERYLKQSEADFARNLVKYRVDLIVLAKNMGGAKANKKAIRLIQRAVDHLYRAEEAMESGKK